MKRLISFLIAALLIPVTALAEPSFQYKATPFAGSTEGATYPAQIDSQRRIVLSPLGTPVPMTGAYILGRTGETGILTGNVGWARISTKAANAGCTTTTISSTAHGVLVGDAILFYSSTNAARAYSFVSAVTDANTFTVSPALPGAPANGDTFIDLRAEPIGITDAGNTTNKQSSMRVTIDSADQEPGNAATNILKTDAQAWATGHSGVVGQFRADSTGVASYTNGNYGPATMNLDGALHTALAAPGQTFQSCGTATATTADVAIKAAVASNRMYVTAITCANSSATVATNLNFKDATTVMAVGGVSQMATASAGSFSAYFNPPLRGSVNTALNFNTAVSTTSVICCANGYISPL